MFLFRLEKENKYENIRKNLIFLKDMIDSGN